MIDVNARVLTTYKADTTDHERGLARIADAVKSEASAEADASKKRNADHAGWIAGLANVGLAYNALEKLAGAAFSSMKVAAEHMRMEAAAGAVDINALSDAAGGLKTHMELLEFAARAQHGAFKLTEEQMGMVEKAMRELTREGFNSEAVMGKVEAAVFSLKTKGLKDLGIQIRETHSDAEKFTAIMEAMTGKAELLGDGTRTDAEAAQAFGVSMHDSMEKIKVAIGSLVIAMTPLLEQIAKAVEGVASLATRGMGGIQVLSHLPQMIGAQQEVDARTQAGEMMGKRFIARQGSLQSGGDTINGKWVPLDEKATEDIKKDLADLAVAIAENRKLRTLAENIIAGRISDARRMGVHGDSDTNGEPNAPGGPQQSRMIDLDLGGPRANASWAEKMAKGGGRGEEPIVMKLDPIDASLLAKLTGQENAAEGKNVYDPAGLIKRDDAITRAQGDSADALTRLQMVSEDADFKKSEHETFLEKTFGKTEEFENYAKAFKTLTGASEAAFGAWIDGSMSAGKAFEKFISSALKGMATQLLGIGITEGVKALVAVASYNYPEAAEHTVAAAKAFAGAAIIGGIAHAMGSGGAAPPSGGTSGSGGGSGPSGGTGSSGSGGPRQAVIVVGNDFDETQRMKQIKAKRYVDLALGQMGYGVEDK